MTTKTKNLKLLTQHLTHIQDTALRIHEEMEKNASMLPLLELEKRLIGQQNSIDTDSRLTFLWAIFLFLKPFTISQKNFQQKLHLELDSNDERLILRQLQNQSLKIWSYRKTLNNRGIAHTIYGPQKFREIFFDDIISVDANQLNDSHYYGYAWTLFYDNKNILVFCECISQKQTYQLSNIHPFPTYNDDDAFWEENLINIIKLITPLKQPYPPAKYPLELTNYQPERILFSLNTFLTVATETPLQYFDNLYSVHHLIAIAENETDLYPLKLLFQKMTAKNPSLNDDISWDRVLQSYNLNEDATIPSTHDKILLNDPCALLLLNEEHPVFQTLHPREPIRLALQWETENIKNTELLDIHKAFRQYKIEQRWIASFKNYDFSYDNHIAAMPLTKLSSDIENIFQDSALRTNIIPPTNELDKIYAQFFSDQTEISIHQLIKIIHSYAFSKIPLNLANLIYLNLWESIKTYRNRTAQIETSINNERYITKNNQQQLENALSELESLFKK